jgi:hypothetical protein
MDRHPLACISDSSDIVLPGYPKMEHVMMHYATQAKSIPGCNSQHLGKGSVRLVVSDYGFLFIRIAHNIV